MKTNCFLFAVVLVDAGESLAEVWEPMKSYTLSVPSLVAEWCGLVEFCLSLKFGSSVLQHTWKSVI